MVQLLRKRSQRLARRENLCPIPCLQEERGSQQKSKRQGETCVSFHVRDSTFVHST